MIAGLVARLSCGEAVDLEHREHECDAVAGAALLGRGGPRHVAVQPAALVLGVRVRVRVGVRVRVRVGVRVRVRVRVNQVCGVEARVGREVRVLAVGGLEGRACSRVRGRKRVRGRD